MSEEFERENKEGLEEIISKPVIIKAEAYKTIILYASRYANQAIPPKDWKEIYGILTGYSDNDFVYVEKAHALTFGHDTDVSLDERHYIFIDEIQQQLDMEGEGQFIVGWFHSHPGLSLFFSYVDLINQLGFQAKYNDA
ncbi:MAG: Mov34/MPN/PAD-1 family protein, partial [Promethearchaeota archaeon]